MSTIQSRAQDLGGHNFVELFTLDCTSLVGGSIYHFTNSLPPETGNISFGNVVYSSYPIQATGFDITGDGSQVKPKITVSNVSRTFVAAILSMGDLVGAKLTRITTFAEYLDGQASADSSQHFPTDVFYVEQKISQDKVAISWQLCSAIDRLGVRLPRRQVTRQGDSRWDNGFKGVGATRGNGY
jgi:lambda family phage minor tail protein L